MRHLLPCLAALAAALPAQTVLLDINPGPGSSGPANVVRSGDRIFFTANDGVSSRELWTSDGTPAGTHLVVDLQPGPGSAGVANLVAVAGGVAFRATQFTQPNTLYFSDGGTTYVVTNPEVYGTGAYLAGGDRSTLFFVASTQYGARGELFMRSATGLVTRITDFYATDFNSMVSEILAVDGDRAWVTVITTSSTELYVCDGGGPRRVAFPPGTSMRGGSIPAADLLGRLWFAGLDAQNGVELWVADPGTATAARLGDLNPGSASSDPARFVVLGSDVVFTAVTAANGQELFKYQPNAPAPVLLADVIPGPQSGVGAWPLFVSGPNLFFVGFTPAAGEELWRSNGTAAGTALVRDVEPGPGHGGPGAFVAPICTNGSVLFAGADAVHGRELWISDGTTGGTRILFELIPGSGSGIPAVGNGWATLLGTTWIVMGSTAATGDELFTFATSASRTPCTTCPVAGCPGSNGVPTLAAVGQPTLGNAAFAVRLQGARATSIALLLLDGPGAPIQLAGGCTLFTGFTPSIAVQFTDSVGAALQVLPIPADPALLGAALRSQWAVVDPAGAFLATLSLSNGCHLVLGN